MEYWSIAPDRNCPRFRGVWNAFRAISWVALPRAEALGYDLEPLRGKIRQPPAIMNRSFAAGAKRPTAFAV